MLLAPVDPRVKAPKYSMMDAPFPFFITPHLTFQTLGLPSNDKPTIYNGLPGPGADRRYGIGRVGSWLYRMNGATIEQSDQCT